MASVLCHRLLSRETGPVNKQVFWPTLLLATLLVM